MPPAPRSGPCSTGPRETIGATDLALDANGRLHVIGTMAAQEGGVERSDTDAALLVLDPAGGLLLHEVWTSAADDHPTAVAVDPCGGIVVTGYTDGDVAGEPHGGRDGFVLVTRVTE